MLKLEGSAGHPEVTRGHLVQLPAPGCGLLVTRPSSLCVCVFSCVSPQDSCRWI